ncbi:GntR family transcriptional regulator [Paractinoplanes atraurantiacus]|uniref:DNA-binding transcriptional regulator, GntR family n=1 Tax=Paractinoplanes atraurantiacus TaxID=1036182 RepID=A0A285I776_9ACTN|nr:GntR family transcriptional regulator [Actinoplanes atraurantiacus]SNY42801.1 DNA-binding transcriptional regulator, GntR family [Actinoplanes atraurantiacus]
MTLPRLKRSTLGDDVYDSLRSAVLEHVMKPGDRLNIDALARDLEVSPTPVREALARMESEGLVRKRPLAGYTVSPLLTRDEFNDMFDMRLLLECAAARWAATRATPEQRSALTAAAARTVEGGDDRTWHAAFTALDAHLHDLVAEASGSPLLRESITRLHAHLHLHRRYFPYAQTAVTNDEHQQIAAAVENADPDAADEAMRLHLTHAWERHLVAFQD